MFVSMLCLYVCMYTIAKERRICSKNYKLRQEKIYLKNEWAHTTSVNRTVCPKSSTMQRRAPECMRSTSSVCCGGRVTSDAHGIPHCSCSWTQPIYFTDYVNDSNSKGQVRLKVNQSNICVQEQMQPVNMVLDFMYYSYKKKIICISTLVTTYYFGVRRPFLRCVKLNEVNYTFNYIIS